MFGGSSYFASKAAGAEAELIHWYDADDASTFTYSSGTIVSQWDDKVGTNHVTQGVVANQPTRNATGYNGKGTVSFDGVDNFLSGSAIPEMATLNFTLFMVLDVSAGPTPGPPVSFRNPIANRPDGYFPIFGNGDRYYPGTYPTPLPNRWERVTPSDASGRLVITHVCTPTSNTYYHDASNVTFTPPGTQVLLGSDFNAWNFALRDLSIYWEGNLSEVRVYNKAMTPAEAALEHSVLISKWGI